MEKIQIGQITSAVGLAGEVKVYNYAESKERYKTLKELYLEEDRLFPVERVRFVKEMVVLKLGGIEDRTAAEGLRGQGVFIPETELLPLQEGSYYIRDLLGAAVVDENQNHLGRLVDVIRNLGHDLYEVETGQGKRFLIPAVEEFILEIAPERGEIRVKLIEGLLES